MSFLFTYKVNSSPWADDPILDFSLKDIAPGLVHLSPLHHWLSPLHWISPFSMETCNTTSLLLLYILLQQLYHFSVAIWTKLPSSCFLLAIFPSLIFCQTHSSQASIPISSPQVSCQGQWFSHCQIQWSFLSFHLIGFVPFVQHSWSLCPLKNTVLYSLCCWDTILWGLVLLCWCQINEHPLL